MDFLVDFMELFIPALGIIGTFTFLAVLVWVAQRRREREAFYRQELARQLVAKGVAEDKLLALLREESQGRSGRRRLAILLAGMVTLATGLGVMFALSFNEGSEWAFGAIPTLIGAALLAFGLFLAPRGGL